MLRERDTASKYTPPAALARIALERTRAIVRTWGTELPWGPVDFMTLAESCYMQGVNDTIEAVLKQGWIPDSTIAAPLASAFDEPMD